MDADDWLLVAAWVFVIAGCALGFWNVAVGLGCWAVAVAFCVVGIRRWYRPWP